MAVTPPAPGIISPSLSASRRGAALWALARMGDQAALQPFVAAVDAAANSADQTRGLYDLVCLRRPESVVALVRLLFQDEPPRQNQEPTDVIIVPIAATAAGYLSDIVEDFPVKGERMDEAKVEQARQ